MIVQIEGKDVEISNEMGMAALKDAPEYNAELDRMRLKGEAGVRDALTGEHSTSLEALKSTHAVELEAAQKVSGGKRDEQIEGLTTQIKTLTDSFNTSELARTELLKVNKTSVIENELINGLSGVKDPYDKTNITRDAMARLNPETGMFALSTGAEGGVKDIVLELQGLHPGRFLSNQPNGNGITGGALGGPNLLAAALGGDMAAKLEYTKQHGMPAYLAEVTKAAVPQT